MASRKMVQMKAEIRVTDVENKRIATKLGRGGMNCQIGVYTMYKTDN